MKRSSLFAELKKHPWILAVVILAHVGLAILLSINLSHDDKPPMPAAKKHDIIDAVAVDAKAFDERKKQTELEEKRKREQALNEKKRQQELARKKAEEKKALERKKAEEKKKLEQKKLAEQKRQQQLKREQERIAKEKQLALAKKKEQEKKERERLEKQRLEKERLEKERLEKERLAKLEAERKRKEEEARRRAEEKAELERAVLEEERRREEAARQAERAARLQTMKAQYMQMIRLDVESAWRRPPGNDAGQSCVVNVTQAGSGDVISVNVRSCNGTDAFQKSVERAVWRASPLPLPPDPELFAKELEFRFKP